MLLRLLLKLFLQLLLLLLLLLNAAVSTELDSSARHKTWPDDAIRRQSIGAAASPADTRRPAVDVTRQRRVQRRRRLRPICARRRRSAVTDRDRRTARSANVVVRCAGRGDVVEILVAPRTTTLLCQLLLNIFDVVIHTCLAVIDVVISLSFINALQPNPLSKSVNCNENTKSINPLE